MPPLEVAAITQLRDLAKGKESSAIQARTALATAGDSSVSRQLVAQLGAAERGAPEPGRARLFSISAITLTRPPD